MPTLNRFWLALECLGGQAAVQEAWRLSCGPEYRTAERFLQPTAEIAGCYPRTNPLQRRGWRAPYRIVQLPDGEFLGVAPDDSPAITLPRPQVAVHRLHRQRLVRRIAAAIGFPAECESVSGFQTAFRIGTLMELYSEPHDFQTVVIDSADWLERLIWAHVCRTRGKEAIEDFGYGKGYTYALEPWKEVLDGLDALRNERGMMVILLAHAKIERFENPETDAYDRYSPRLNKHASSYVQEWCDEVLFATYKVHTKQTEEGFDRTRTRGIGTGDRILRTTERPAHVAKNRLGLPEELPLDYAAYAHCLNPAAHEAA